MEFAELFDAQCCYDWFENVVHGREEDVAGKQQMNDEDDGQQYDCPPEFEDALQSLKSPPAIRAAGPYMLRVVCEWLGANDSRLKVLVGPIVDSLCIQLDKQCNEILAAQNANTCGEGANTHERTTPGAPNLSSRFVTSVVFCLLCVFDIYQWDILPVARLYWSWLSYLLQTKEDADVQKLMSPMILSLILKPTYTAAKVALPELGQAIEMKPISLAAAFLGSEAGLEVVRKILDTFCSGSKEADQLAVYNFVKILVKQALKISDSKEMNKVLNPLSATSEMLMVNPIITLSNLILRLSLPYINQTRAKTKECQIACLKILKALADHAPCLFEDDCRKYYHLFESTQNDDSSSKCANSLKQLYEDVTSPWISFVAMVLTSLPERKDCRERACAILMECFGQIPRGFHQNLSNMVRMLSAFHDRGTVRLAATELLTMLTDEGDESKEQIFHDLILRTSDVSAIVRARALELLAQVIAGRSTTFDENSPIVNPAISPSPMILISQSPRPQSASVNLNENDLIRNQIQCVLHARVLDEKSVVRKGCIPLIEVVFQREVLSSELMIIERELLEVLADDLIITIRQRFVSTLASMLNSWLNGAGGGVPSQANLILTQLARLASDAEEVVYNKVLDAMDSIVLPTLKTALNHTEPSRAQTLLSVLVSDEECSEWVGRAIIKLLECRYSETSPWSGPANEYVSLLKSICGKPRGVRAIRLLLILVNAGHRALCKTATGAASTALGSACLCIFEDITPMIGPATDLILCNAALEVLTHLAPVHVDVRNRKLIFDSFYQALLCGSVHPSLLLKVALLTIVIMPRDQASVSCMAYLSYAKRQLSKFKLADPSFGAESRKADANGRVLACACLLCGFASAVQLVLKCPKLSKFLQQMNKALAVTILSISRYHEEAQVRSMALVAVSHVLLNDESLAKKHMSKLVQTAIAAHSTVHTGVMTNLPFATYDFSVCLTSVMDPYLTIVTACLAQSYGSSAENRFAALLLISQLAGLDFIKCKGLIMHHVIYALGDDCSEVSDLAYEILQSVLLPRLKDLILVYFAETVCFLTGYYEHFNSIRAFTFAHPLQREVVKTYEDLNVCAFLALEDHGRRFKIYSRLLSLSQEQSKHLLTGKLLQDFIKPLVPMEDDLPTDSNSRRGRALADVLRIISSADMKLRFKNVATPNDPFDGGASDMGTGAESLAKAKYERDLMASYMTQNVVPTLLTLHQALRKKNSALQRDVVEAISDIVGELDCNMEDLINDKALRRRVEERVNAHPHTCAGNIFDPLSDGSRKKLMSPQAR